MKYSKELKEHIINKVLNEEIRICEIAKQYSLSNKRVSSWVCERRKKNSQITEFSKEELLERIAFLEKENKSLSEDCDILKKATALFVHRKKIK